ncbi:CAP domain-containing protein [Pararhizobium mangrovi]|uniref:CAP domain-containing protein n=1 Tax=Pararhizobium mangrovi TaxID=2590452 RepID=A0A506TUR2_9HYPH|nr:CAP domain-containing protein [Pararhizobium mangrovi]TPW25803.1 CAP domain-containing protein [Pararhizobium mangrovi]
MTFGMLAGCGTFHTPDGVAGQAIVSSEALARVNAFRSKNGRRPLVTDRNASRAALRQAETMASNSEMAHNIGLGANFPDRMARDGVPLPAGENIAEGQKSIAAAISSWEASPHHRANMLNGAYSGIGVAVAQNAKTGRHYWSMVLTGQ